MLQRTVVNWFIPLRTIERSRSDQLAGALFSVLLPLLITVLGVHEINPLHRFIFHQYVETTGISARADAKALFSCAVSDDIFKKNTDSFYAALARTWHSTWPVLLTFYGVCILIAVGMGWATQSYGPIRAWSEKSKYARWLPAFFLQKLLLEKVSFWHALLTPFTLADKSATITLDILTSDGILYQGISYQHFLDSDSKLAGVVLKNPRRFARDLYKAAKSQAENQSIDKEQFWRVIPGDNLFILGSSIVNINVNYLPSQTSRVDILQRFIAQTLNAKQRIKITIELPNSAE